MFKKKYYYYYFNNQLNKMSIIKQPEENVNFLRDEENKPTIIKRQPSVISRSRTFLFNVKTLIFSLIIMLLTGMIYLVQQSILDTEFLEKLGENIQNKIHNRFSFTSAERINFCENKIISNITIFQKLNITEYYDTFISWQQAICSK
jgi:hypothetical protein